MIVVDLGMFYLYDRLGEAYQDKMQQRLLKEHMMAYQEQMHIMQQNQKKLDSLPSNVKQLRELYRERDSRINWGKKKLVNYLRSAGVKIPPLMSFTRAVEMVIELPTHP